MHEISLIAVQKRVFRFRTTISFFMSVFMLTASAAMADTINITDDVQTYTSLSGDIVNMSGVSELHVTSATTPITGCTINLNSEDSFLVLNNIKPSTVNTSTYLSQIKVNGANAVLNTNIRIVQYADGAVVIPHASSFQPLQVFTEENFQGDSQYLSQYSQYNTSSLGTMANEISSFILKRGYTATFAQTEYGTGYSKNYVAQDCDLEIAVLPTKLNNKVNFIRVFPWRWISKKGIGGNIGSNLDIKWWYNWNIDQNSPLDKEYVPIRQNRWWPGLDQNWQARGASHLLGYNEPDSSSQANIAVGDAIWSWPDLLGTGLRVGSPATTDGGRSGWLYPFMDQADAADLRVDFVAVHYYWCYDPSNPSGAASQMYNYLKEVHDRTGRPIWITEWNNGANWTGCADPTYEQQAACIGAMIDMLDSTPWVERYAIYNWVEDVRRVQWDDGWPTQAGEVYRDQVSPIGYQQEIPGSGKSANAIYNFDENFRDSSGNGNNPLVYGAPKRQPGQHDNSVVLDGADDYLVLPTHMGEDADFTFSAWVYWNGGGNWQRIFDFGNDTNTYMFLTPSQGNAMRFTITTSGWGGEQRIETSPLATDTWVHVAVTLSGDTGTLYVNGSPAATTSITLDPSDFNPENNYLGKSQFSVDPLFDGMLDDVVIAHYALSSDQINELISSNQPARFITAPLPIVGSIAGSEEQATGVGNWKENSYDRHRGTRWCSDGIVANSWIEYDLGTSQEIEKIRLNFYKGDTRTYPIRIEIDGTTVFNGNTAMTSGYWETSITPTTGQVIRITMTGNNSSGNGWFSIWEAQIWESLNEPPSFNTSPLAEVDAVELSDYDSTLIDDASDPENGSLSFSKDDGPDWLAVAPDGTLSGIPLNANVGLNEFTVRVTDSSGLSDTATMTIDVANIYSGTQGLPDFAGLAAQWLTTDCGLCAGADLSSDANVDMVDLDMLAYNWLGDESLQLHFKFDETGGAIAEDRSIYTRAGDLTNGPTWTTGTLGGALSFDGVDDYVEVTDYKGIPGSATRTCMAWIKTSQAGKEIVNWGEEYAGGRWVVRVNEGGQLRAEVQGGNIIGTTLLNDNTWHHVAVVLADDGSADINEARLYVDGNLETVSSSADEPVNSGSYQNVQIGWYYIADRYFNGLIDDVRIYSTVLTEEEIESISGM